MKLTANSIQIDDLSLVFEGLASSQDTPLSWAVMRGDDRLATMYYDPRQGGRFAGPGRINTTLSEDELDAVVDQIFAAIDIDGSLDGLDRAHRAHKDLASKDAVQDRAKRNGLVLRSLSWSKLETLQAMAVSLELYEERGELRSFGDYTITVASKGQWKPTHRLTDKHVIVEVMLVDHLAYTMGAWESGSPDWEYYGDLGWCREGQPVDVRVEEL